MKEMQFKKSARKAMNAYITKEFNAVGALSIPSSQKPVRIAATE